MIEYTVQQILPNKRLISFSGVNKDVQAVLSCLFIIKLGCGSVQVDVVAHTVDVGVAQPQAGQVGKAIPWPSQLPIKQSNKSLNCELIVQL